MVSKLLKRFIDVVGSVTGLLFLLLVIILIALVVRVTLGAPIIFKQNRPGKNGKSFTFYKFRTMTEKCDSNGELLPDKNRITSLGNFLRKTSLDELPSLFNVLKGEMSLVGPRPLLVEYLELYTPEQARRQEVKPGITGWAQINGRNTISWEEKFKLDVWYVDNQSFWLDIKILIITIFKVIMRKGINQSGSTTMDRFRGSF